MQPLSRERVIRRSAIAAIVIGVLMMVFGTVFRSSSAFGGLASLPLTNETFEMLGGVFVPPVPLLGAAVAAAGLLTVALLTGRRFPAAPRAVGERSLRFRPRRVVWWAAALLTAIGAGRLVEGLSTPQPRFWMSFADGMQPPPREPMTVLTDPGLLLDGIVVVQATFVGTALTLTGLITMAVLAGGHRRASRPATVPAHSA